MTLTIAWLALAQPREFGELAPAFCVEKAPIILRLATVRKALAVMPEQEKELDQIAFASQRAAQAIRDLFGRDRAQAGRRALLEKVAADPLLNRQMADAGIGEILTAKQTALLARLRVQLAGPLFLHLSERTRPAVPDGRFAEAVKAAGKAVSKAMLFSGVRPHGEKVELALAARPPALAALTAALAERQRKELEELAGPALDVTETLREYGNCYGIRARGNLLEMEWADPTNGQASITRPLIRGAIREFAGMNQAELRAVGAIYRDARRVDSLLRDLFGRRLCALDAQEASARVYYVTECSDFDEEVRRAVRPETWDRLVALRFQAFGIGDAYSIYGRKAIGIPNADANRIVTEAPLGQEYAERGILDRYRADKDRYFLNAMTPEQRAKWERLRGEPIARETLLTAGASYNRKGPPADPWPGD